MGKSVLLYDGQNTSGPSKSDETVLNMDLMQKQQMQKRLIINEEVKFLKNSFNFN